MRCLYALVGVGLRYTYSVKKKTETHVQNYTLGTTFLLVLTHGIIRNIPSKKKFENSGTKIINQFA
jgi:4-hydroxybenzoate polyprenyltransferase